jgi:hypothetical protein
MAPRVVLDGEGEGYLFVRDNDWIDPALGWRENGAVAIAAPAGKDVTGKLYLAKPDLSGMAVVTFRLPSREAQAQGAERFWRAKLNHYGRLRNSGVPGGAWYRRQVAAARRELEALGVKDLAADRTQPPSGWTDDNGLYDLFSGGRAVSENLQLDRQLLVGNRAGEENKPDDTPVDLATIQGITVQELDWKKLTQGQQPKLDPLAASIPADQHALFMPSFAAALSLVDEASASGTPLLHLAEPRSEDARTLERYQRQLGFSLSAAARLLGPQLIDSLAITGSDPYFRTGTDVAVLMEAKNPAAVAALLLAQATDAAKDLPEVKAVKTKVGEVPVSVVMSADRTISSFIAVVGKAVVVTNSPVQMERLVDVAAGKSSAISTLGEYAFFRQRYPLGDPAEAGLLFLSDATIRRWCGPKWRIASARRTLADAVMADAQAARLGELVAGKFDAQASLETADLVDLGKVQLTPGAVNSSIYGSLAFGTPIVELEINQVTRDERTGYERWRDTYQQNWRQFFDPIAIRFEVRPDRLGADVSVMPLILGTSYRQFLSIVLGAKIAPGAGDPHDDLLHFVMAFNRKSELVRQASNFAVAMAPGVKIDPFGWLGESVAVYVDDDPLWAELAKAEGAERDAFFSNNLGRLPVALHAEVTDGLKLTAFLAALRGFVEQTAPGMVTWESLKHGEQAYVKVAEANPNSLGLGKFAIHYYASGDAFILSLNEETLKRAIDRQVARRAAKGANATSPTSKAAETTATSAPGAWLGTSVAFHVDAKAIGFLAGAGQFLGGDYQSMMQRVAWSSLPILNEWKRLYPDRDPLEVHERLTRVRLVCPGGGKYVWNDAWQTMESTVYGHPGEPKAGPAAPTLLETVRSADFGLTFEQDGLRARVELSRQAK